ncbi:MAG: CidA/LrgA family protein [Tissierellia bacterium]|nr:CidA/LrgA family protein [Tissierellia bacterium]
MKKGTGIVIIMVVLLIGQILSMVIPVKIPGPIYGMVLLLIGLTKGILPLEDVERVSQVLIGNMILMFVPGGVKLIQVFDQLVDSLLPLIIVLLVSTFVTMGVTAFVADVTIGYFERKDS